MQLNVYAIPRTFAGGTMRSGMMLYALFALFFVAAIADHDVSLVANDEESNFMEDTPFEEDVPEKINFDSEMEAPGLNLTIPRRAIIAARKLSVPIPLLLHATGINTSYRHSYCFHLLRYSKSAALS